MIILYYNAIILLKFFVRPIQLCCCRLTLQVGDWVASDIFGELALLCCRHIAIFNKQQRVAVGPGHGHFHSIGQVS